MKKISLLAIAIFFALSSFAQLQDSTLVPRKHEIGMHLGATTGMGLSYRYWPTRLGGQFTILPVKNGKNFFVTIGATALYTFFDSKNIRFFGYLGNHIIINRFESVDYSNTYYYDANGNYHTNNQSPKIGMETKKTYNVGFGPGLSFGDRVRFNIMVGYAGYDILNDFDILPTGEIGLYFRI